MPRTSEFKDCPKPHYVETAGPVCLRQCMVREVIAAAAVGNQWFNVRLGTGLNGRPLAPEKNPISDQCRGWTSATRQTVEQSSLLSLITAQELRRMPGRPILFDTRMMCCLDQNTSSCRFFH
jgi:hypothetical protein